MNADQYISLVYAKPLGQRIMECFHHLLNFQIVIAGTEGAHFVLLPLFCFFRDMLRQRSRHLAMLFYAVEVFRAPVSSFDGPLGSTGQHSLHLLGGEVQPPCTADTGRDGLIEPVGQLHLHRLNILPSKTSVEGTHSTGNIKSHSPGRHHPAAIRIKGCHSANRKTITPMGIRHGIRGLDNSGKGGHVGDLFIDFLIHSLNQVVSGKNDPRHAHLSLWWNMPFVFGNLGQLGTIHLSLRSFTHLQRIGRPTDHLDAGARRVRCR